MIMTWKSPSGGKSFPTNCWTAGSTSGSESPSSAVLSLIFSILGLCGFCCGFFLVAAIGGIVCGHLALSRIKANPELEGHGLAMAGLVIGYVAVASWLVWILLFGGLAVLQGITESMTKH